MRTILAAFTLSTLGIAPLDAQETLHALMGDIYHNHFGTSVAALRDVDGDGLGDVAIGATFTNPRVHVISGATGAEIHKIVVTEVGFGRTIAGVGDIDGDGRGDLVVQSSVTVASGGLLHAFSGATGALLFTVAPGGAVIDLLAPVVAVGDWNLDGVPDFAGGGGQAHVFSGVNGALLFTANHGYSALAAADVDLDGQRDLILGSWSFDVVKDEGRVLVVSGANGAVLHTWIGASQEEHLGFAVAALDDLNGDGAPEVLIGAPASGITLPHIEVRSGATGAILRSVEGTITTRLGAAVAAVGDVNGDGAQDYAAGAPDDIVDGVRSGAVHVYSGVQNGVSLWSAAQGGDLAFFGAALAGAGDVNGNGGDDLVVGAWHGEAQNGTLSAVAGAAFLISGICGSVASFGGLTCPGSGGYPVLLQGHGCATAGTVLTLEVTQVLGNAPGLLMLGAQGTTPLPGPCLLPLAGILPVTQALFAPGAGPGAGSLTLPVKIPVGTIPFEIYLAALFLDPGAQGGITVSNRVRLRME